MCGKMNSVSGFIYTFDGNRVTLKVGTEESIRAEAVLSDTFDFGDCEKHSIAFALCRQEPTEEQATRLSIALYVDGYFVGLTRAEGSTATAPRSPPIPPYIFIRLT